MKRFALRRALALAGMLLVTLLLLELGVFGAVRSGLLATPAPTHGRVEYWQGDHPELGVWHRPNSAWEHTTPCFEVTYRSNAIGARDVDRTQHAEHPRVVVLGDSFLEGWGVARRERLSDLLEARTGLEHLNLAMAHFGPYQALLAYESLARRYDHDAVILGVLPTNDFVDLDPERAGRLAGYDYRWRPYLVADGAEWRRLDLREPVWRRTLRERSYAFNAARVALQTLRASPQPAARPLHSGYWEFEPRDLRVLEAIFERLGAAVDGRRVAIVLIPTLVDLQRFARDGPAPLAARLEPVARRLGFALVDLLPAMARRTSTPASYFHSCDYHWSRYGNRVAADVLYEALAADYYAPLEAGAAGRVERGG